MKPQRKSIISSFLLPIAIGTAFCLQSCEKFLEIPPPTTELVTTNVLNNNASATAALLNVYFVMFNITESFNMAENMGVYADELQSYDNQDALQIELYTNSLQAFQNPGPWTEGGGSYSYIYQANAIISGLQSISGCSPAVKQQLTGEAYFIRAFWHFCLTNIYGAVPLVLTTNYQANALLARTTRVQVLQQVVADLQTANSLLNTSYVDGSDTLSTTERVRPNKSVALALLARAYLYLGDYSQNAAYYVKADSASTAVIGNSNYSLSPLNSVFLANSSEAIWQLQTPQPAPLADTYDGVNFILLGAPNNNSGPNGSTISTQLMNAFEPGDQRQANWIGSITEGTSTYYFPYKYKQNTYVGTEYTMVLRLGEQYLIRAEAEAHEGKTGNAVTDLNMIRTRAGLPNYAGAQDQTSLLATILHERQVELFTEWGARWFDVCRTGNANQVMSVVCPQKGGTWSSTGYQLLFPVPQADILVDHNLSQNPGY
jgi:hypothetical protein